MFRYRRATAIVYLYIDTIEFLKLAILCSSYVCGRAYPGWDRDSFAKANPSAFGTVPRHAVQKRRQNYFRFDTSAI